MEYRKLDLAPIDVTKLTESQRTKFRRIQEDLEVVLKELDNPEVFSVNLNADGKLFKKGVRGKSCFGTLDSKLARKAINTISNYTGKGIIEESPFLESIIPVYGHRFSASIAPATKNPTFSIRKRASKIYTLDEWVEQGSLEETHRLTLREAISRRRNILLVGGTESGKTTFANALLDEISKIHPTKRVGIIEDVDELQCNSEDHLKMELPQFNEPDAPVFTLDYLLNRLMRRDPEIVVVGEVRGPEAITLLKAWNSGHPGGIATIHADDAQTGLLKLEQYIEEGNVKPNPQLIAKTVHYVVSIQKVINYDENGEPYESRKIEEVLELEKYAYGKYRGTDM